jgi:hypothetical protein
MLQRFMGLLFFVIATVSFLNTATACTPPEIPSCFSSQGLTSGRPDYNYCRGQINYYQDYGNNYIRCLQSSNYRASEINRAAQTIQNNLNAIISAFNQMFGR